MVDPWHIDPIHITIRLAAALLLGGLIGVEREQTKHAAGLRTHILVSLGSALIMLLSIYGFADFVKEPHVSVDPSRMAAQVITGIGFLGAGTILFNGFSVTGLTTAASLWVVAAIGLSVGAGFYFPAAITTVLVLVNLLFLNKLERKLFREKKIHQIRIHIQDQPGSLGAISAILNASKIEIRKVAMEDLKTISNDEGITIYFTVKFPSSNMIIPTMDKIRKLSGLFEVSIE